MKNTYQEQAEKFLADTKTTLEVIECVPQTAPLWAKQTPRNGELAHGIKYSVTLKNARHAYTFDFWGSIFDAEKVQLAETATRRGNQSREFFKLKDFLKENGVSLLSPYASSKEIKEKIQKIITPGAYDILACLDTYSACDTFEDFCSSYGYDSDSRTAYDTYNAVQTQTVNLQKLFTHTELEALNEIK